MLLVHIININAVIAMEIVFGAELRLLVMNSAMSLGSWNMYGQCLDETISAAQSLHLPVALRNAGARHPQ